MKLITGSKQIGFVAYKLQTKFFEQENNYMIHEHYEASYYLLFINM